MAQTLHDLTALPAGALQYVQRPDGTRLRCIAAGTGAPVVLAHGVLSSLTVYNLVVPELLARGHRVILFDQRGHIGSSIGADGMSTRAMASDYAAVLEHFGCEDALLVGHSMGAYLSVAFAILHADAARARLRGMVLVGGTAGDVARGSPQNRLQIPLLRSGILQRLARQPTVGRWIARSLFGRPPAPELLEVSRRTLVDQDARGIVPMIVEMVGADLYPRLGEIAVPTRVICGELDRTCPRWHSERLGAEIPGASIVWLQGVGHMVPYEDPRAIVDAIAQLHAASGGAQALRA